jgi:hypothetical protein
MNISDKYPRLFALGLTIAFFGLVWLYYRELNVFSNSIKVRYMVLGSLCFSLMASGLFLWWKRDRFTPWDRHLPEFFFILLMPMLFAPLFGSLLNRRLGHSGNQSFIFVSETPFIATGYGLIKGEEPKVNGYFLIVKDEYGVRHRFKHKKRAFPLTQPGELVYLPVRWGILGITVVMLDSI